ncbi:MAG: hypothetical protein R2838_17355 [Caldilineaceae bacterium]
MQPDPVRRRPTTGRGHGRAPLLLPCQPGRREAQSTGARRRLPLPSFYSMERDGNNIESIAGGFASAQDAWTGLLGSPAHRRHLLGEVDFYREQIDLGIGFVEDPDSDYRYYWVILTARTGE